MTEYLIYLSLAALILALPLLRALKDFVEEDFDNGTLMLIMAAIATGFIYWTYQEVYDEAFATDVDKVPRISSSVRGSVLNDPVPPYPDPCDPRAFRNRSYPDMCK